MPLTPQGYIALTGAEFLAEIRTEFETQTGYTPDWTYDEFLGVITAVMASILDEQSQGVQQLADSFDINNATGVSLDKLVGLLGITRQEATPSVATVDVTGTNGTIIPSGSIVQSASDGERWRTLTDITIAGGVGTTVVQAETLGPVAAVAGDISVITTAIFGWDTVTNGAAANIGEARESDEDLRARRRFALQSGTSATLNAIRSAADNLDFISAVTAVENDTAVAATVDGIAMNPNSWAIVVYPSTLTAEQQTTLAEALYAVAPAGIESIGSQSEVVETKTIRWSYASDVDVDVVIATTLVGVSLAEVTPEIDTLVTDYFASLEVGDDVRILALCALLDSVDGVDAVTITLNGFGNNVSVSAAERADLSSLVVT